MSQLQIRGETLPGLYQAADQAANDAQRLYFTLLLSYLSILVLAALVAWIWPSNVWGAIGSAILFLFSLALLVYLRTQRPDDEWYHGRAVAESVKTRAWRWCMRAEPYDDCDDPELVSRQFIADLKAILKQNKTLAGALSTESGIQDPISAEMRAVRALDVAGRLDIYKRERIDDQKNWYSLGSSRNKRNAKRWFLVSVALHVLAVALLLCEIRSPQLDLPIEVVAVAAGAALTWLQAKKHNELTSSYSLAAHEIQLVKGEALSISTDSQLSDFVLNSETAFSREHTQWAARKLE